MYSNRSYVFSRSLIQGLLAFVMLFSAAAGASTVSAATPPANDNFANAIKIGGASYSHSISDMTAATMEGLEPPLTCDGGGLGEASVWYTFQPAQSGQVTLSSKYSGYDTIITIFKAAYDLGAIVPPGPAPVDPSSLIEMGCNDDVSIGNTTSSLTMPLRGGVRYYIEVVRKTGAPATPPDTLKFSLQYSARASAMPDFYDALYMPAYFSPRGWQFYPVPVAHNGNVLIGNNPGDMMTVFFEGESVQICSAQGPVFGNMDVYLDDVYVTTLAQGNAVYFMPPCWDSLVDGGLLPPFPGSSALAYDNLHKLTLKHVGPAGTKVNIDTIQIFPLWDFDPPASVTDLTGTVSSTGKVSLTWSATGDDSLFGSPLSYGRVHHNEIRYRLTPFAVFPADWDSASPYTNTTTTPLPSGSKQTLNITGLAPGVTYYFMVVGVDEAGNMGDPSSSSFVSVVTTASSSGAYGVGLYDDRHSGWKYAGTWKAFRWSDSLNNTLHQANAMNSTAAFKFTGTQFRFYYWAMPNQGLLDVMLDGAFLTTIDQNTTWGARRIYVSPILVNGPHTVQFIQKSLPYVNVDAIGIHNLVDGGPPDPISDLLAVPGFTDGSVDLTWTATGDDGPFPPGTGTASSYEVRYSTSPILTQADWELAQPAPGVIPLPQPAGSGEAMTVTGLVPGVTYWFAILQTDNAGYSNLSNTASATAFANPLLYQGAGIYEDTDPNWLYYGIWTQLFPIPASGGDLHRCDLANSSAVFLFTTSGFTLMYQTQAGYSSLKVYVDGVLAGTINQQTTLSTYNQTATFNGYAPGNHSVQFVCTGKASIDRIEILP
ncbi:MAG: hypothetical protein HFACDABA_02801 [Anaerolineales bacterium]|nr:hypothetical protein [Anaerolineales bacterium]